MVDCFQEKYAKYYDLIYRDKNYKKECDYLEKIFKKFIKRKPKTILDLGCGTGGHAIILAKRGYKVTGIDVSKFMVDIAQEKAKEENLNIDFYQGKMQDFNLSKKFDVVIAMFSAIDYLTNYFELRRALQNIKHHLKKNGLFIFDFWNGLAVLDHYSPQRVKIIQNKEVKIKRIAETKIDAIRKLVYVHYRCFVYLNGKIEDKFKETHRVRYFFSEELKNILLKNGFSLRGLYPFLNFREELNKKDWDITIIASPYYGKNLHNS